MPARRSCGLVFQFGDLVPELTVVENVELPLRGTGTRAGAARARAMDVLGLLGLVLGTVDRALERRRTTARQVAVGVPARILRTAQLLQTLVPLTASLLLAGAGALLLVTAYGPYGMPSGASITGRPLAAFAGAVLASVVLVSAATAPTIRTRLTADLLRRE